MRLLIVSNRLPVTLKKENGNFLYETSVGGLSSGLEDYIKYVSKQKTRSDISEYLWLGWPGITIEEKKRKLVSTKLMQTFHAYPVFIPAKQMDKFYQGFCNKTLWPLFHYFPVLAVFSENYWQSYKTVNEIFLEALTNVVKDEDAIWIHDYHLMLLPQLVRKKFPNLKIGFFLHIPFPSFEIFRLLPKIWREKILRGMLGADLIGFHTQEYTQYFLHCAQRILGYEHNMGKLIVEHRIVRADTYPMGINFDKFNEADDLSLVRAEITKLKSKFHGYKTILSIDRLDYTKGILNRLYAYENFLENNSDWREKVVLLLIVVPSRTGIEHYRQIKKQLDEIVGKINGKFASVNWNPIIYQYKFFDFPLLAALYKISDIALVTPLRDGMNLIAKEYMASKRDKKGVLILSEMAGVAKELGEAIIINPNTIEEITESLKTALNIKEDEQIARNQVMRTRLKNYDIIQWAEEFLYGLQQIYQERNKLNSKIMTLAMKNRLIDEFAAAQNRIIFLDYDGTLAPLFKFPYLAKPSESTLELLRSLVSISNLNVVLISGRNKSVLQDWFPLSQLNLVAEHGIWIKESKGDWKMLKPMANDWKPQLISILKTYTNRVPGTFVEEKEYSVGWHYRNADQDLAALRAKELMDDLVNYTANIDLQVLAGNKVIEIRNAGVNKGTAASHFLAKLTYDFILAVGDDVTDEDLFRILPPQSYAIKVGFGASYAKYNLYNNDEVIDLLQRIVEKFRVS